MTHCQVLHRRGGALTIGTMIAPVPKDKSVAAALVLTFLFGPLGLFYSSVIGGFIMLALYVIVGIATAGLGLLVLWPITMVWGAVAASNSHTQHAAWIAKHTGSAQTLPAHPPPPATLAPPPPPPRHPAALDPPPPPPKALPPPSG